jgi:hypothetical protein
MDHNGKKEEKGGAILLKRVIEKLEMGIYMRQRHKIIWDGSRSKYYITSLIL